MEKASAEMIPLSLPEIKELWMGLGRRGACMHTKKNTLAQQHMLMISQICTPIYKAYMQISMLSTS